MTNFYGKVPNIFSSLSRIHSESFVSIYEFIMLVFYFDEGLLHTIYWTVEPDYVSKSHIHHARILTA